MSQSRDIHSVIVQIFGDEYNILPSEGGPAEVQRIAGFVDQKMKEIAKVQPQLSKAQLAVLAAMDITAEFMRATAEREMLTDKAQKSLDRLDKLIEDRANVSESVPDRTPQSLERLLRARSTRQRDPSSV
tara:strand:+ start:1316 stop:1705 length:390 start_codon:yes stop_codon:yes gene_type:complete